MENTQADILTVDEAAKLLKNPRSFRNRLAQHGKILAQNVCRHWRFYRPKLVKWVAGELVLIYAEEAGGLIK